MALDDPPAEREANAAALERIARVEALERTEDPLRVFLVEADAVVLDDDSPGGRASKRSGWLPRRRDAHDRRCRTAELDRVRDEVLKHLLHLRRVTADDRQV